MKSSMSVLKKANLDKLFNKIVVKSEEMTIAETYQEKCDAISGLTHFFASNGFEHYFTVNPRNLEDEIASCRESYRKNKDSNEASFYLHMSRTEEEYIEKRLYSNIYGNHVDTFFLEKYRQTQKKADKVLLCELKLSSSAQSRILFAVFFNAASQLCFDYITIRKRKWNRSIDIENDIKFLSATTDIEAIETLVRAFPEEEEKIEKESEIRKEKNDKNRIKKDKIKELSTKAVISRIKTLLDEKKISCRIHERYHVLQIILDMKKGKTVINVPKKNIKTKLELIPSLCETIVEADKLNIHCKYNQNM